MLKTPLFIGGSDPSELTMKIINKHVVKITLPRGRRITVIARRRNFLHKKLGSVCMDCGIGREPGLKGMLRMHHIFYPLGFEPNWTYNWQHASADVFWESYYPEIMESCILLCDKCHKKRHGIKKTG